MLNTFIISHKIGKPRNYVWNWHRLDSGSIINDRCSWYK